MYTPSHMQCPPQPAWIYLCAALRQVQALVSVVPPLPAVEGRTSANIGRRSSLKWLAGR